MAWNPSSSARFQEQPRSAGPAPPPHPLRNARHSHSAARGSERDGPVSLPLPPPLPHVDARQPSPKCECGDSLCLACFPARRPPSDLDRHPQPAPTNEPTPSHLAPMRTFKKNYSCHQCHRPFDQRQHLARHMRTVHSSARRWTCWVCSKAFKRSDIFGRHLLTHAVPSLAHRNLLVAPGQLKRDMLVRLGPEMAARLGGRIDLERAKVAARGVGEGVRRRMEMFSLLESGWGRVGSGEMGG